MNGNSKLSSRVDKEIEHFSELSHIWWGAKTIAGQKRYDNKLELFTRLCHLRGKENILEMGCGDGEFSKRLVKLNVNVTATDVTPQVIKRAKKDIKNKRISFKVENAEKISFKNGNFNIVCGISILHHLNAYRALQEAYRVLKNGGQIFFTEPNLLNPHIWLGLHIPYLRQKMEFSPDESALTRWQVAKILKQIGFSDISVVNYDFLHPNTPPLLINFIQVLGRILEKTPIIKEFSGSLMIWAKK